MAASSGAQGAAVDGLLLVPPVPQAGAPRGVASGPAPGGACRLGPSLVPVGPETPSL